MEWEDFEYEFTDKSKDWFWGLGLFAAFFFILAIILGNFLLGVIVVLGTVALVAYAVRPPEFLTYRLTDKGLIVKNRLYPYKQMDSFWIHTEPWFYRLSLKSDRWFLPHILVPLGETDPEEVRKYLDNFLPEEEHEISLLDIITAYLGF